MGLATLIGASILALCALVALIRVAVMQDFGAKLDFWVAWSRISVRVSGILILISLLAKGRFRIAGVLCGLAVITLAVVVWAMK